MVKVLALADFARDAGIGLQLGCQVGETSLLSAAGRYLAMHLPDLKFVEGSYGTLLLEEDIAQPLVVFGAGGEAGQLTGVGWGVVIDEEALRRWSVDVVNVKVN